MFKSLLPVGYLSFCLASISVTVSGQDGEGDPLVVCSPYIGCFRGTTMDGYQTETFQAFMGIPYALPPVGELRLSNPRRWIKQSDTYDATKPKSDCVQKNFMLPTPTITGEEDCLYLNVYRPVPLSEEPLPVMVYIHGGGFIGGSAGPSVSGPEYIMDTQVVILVTVAYRVGALGFLSTEDDHMPGNFGLKDQNLALKWVQENIMYFGGNKDQVTLFGHGIDGVASHIHLMTPGSAGLFQRVISMSGTANVPFALNRKPLEQTRTVAQLSQIENPGTISTEALTDALRKVDVTTLINAGDGFKYWDIDPLSIFRPVIEPKVPDAFLTVDPEEEMICGNYPKLPWLLGTVPQEGAVRVSNLMENFNLLQQFNSKFHYLLRELIQWPARFSQEKKDEKTKAVIAEYLQDIHEINDETMQGFVNLMTDRNFKHPLYRALSDYLKAGDTNHNPVYIYSFNYKGPLSYASIYAKTNVTRNYGVVHGDDLLYLFRSPRYFPDFKRDSTEAKVIQSFVRHIVSFARFGAPQLSGTSIPITEICSTSMLDSRPDGICDYHEFINSDSNPDGFEVRVNTNYPTAKVKLWNDFLEQANQEVTLKV